MAELTVLSLNCWGIWLLSSDRRKRMTAISSHIAQGNYDLVLLQEVWCEEDFQMIREDAKDSLKYTHFFHIGAVGSGTCVLSRYPLQDVTFHEYTVNGNPQDLLHGDWYAGKGLGVCCIKIQDLDVRVFISHLHAEYLSTREAYLATRVVHALEAALWIKLVSAGADLVIFGGDFNSEPGDIPYNTIRAIYPLKDAWIEANGEEGGESCGAEKNSYSNSHSFLPGSCGFKPSEMVQVPKGQRIDFIMFKEGLGLKCSVLSCSQPLPDRIPGTSISYSDHEGVAATIKIEKDIDACENECFNTNNDNGLEKNDALNTALEVVSKRLTQSNWDQLYFYAVTFLCLSFLVVLSSCFDTSCWISTLATLVCSIVATAYFLLGMVVARKEQNALKAARETIHNLLKQKK